VIREPVAALGLGETVRLAGHHSGDAYVELLRGFDALCLLVPGSDGSCRAVLEAAACGVPAVVSRRGALPEIVIDGETGLTRDDAPEALADALLTVLRDDGRTREMGVAAAERARECFAPSRLAADCEALYLASLEAKGLASSIAGARL
jgi:glycosyltransferase involved in cell wall biosynthesis